MGSGKKKDKKKKKRQRSSSSDEEDSEEDYTQEAYAYLEKYKNYINSNSNRKSESYVVEDARPKQLQAIKDNYSYGKSEKKKKHSYRYDDVPETEEYIYDYSGQQIVQSSRGMSLSPEQTDDDDDDYNYKSKSEKNKYTYEQEIIDLTNCSKQKDEKNLKSQKKSLIDTSDNVSSNYTRKKDSRELPDYSSADYTRKKETKESRELPPYSSADYTRKKENKETRELPDYSSADYIRKKEIKESKELTDYSSVDYTRKKETKQPRALPDYSSADYTRKKEAKESRELPGYSSTDYTRKKEIKDSRELPDYSSADYTSKNETKELRNLSDYTTADYTRKKESKELPDNISSNYTLKIDSMEHTDYVSSDYSQKRDSRVKLDNVPTNYGDSQDYSSADYILKKIREQTKFIPPVDVKKESKSDYTASYTHKKESRMQSEYVLGNYKEKSSNELEYDGSNLNQKKAPSAQSDDMSSEYIQKSYSTESSECVCSNTQKKSLTESSDYVTSEYVKKNNSTKQSLSSEYSEDASKLSDYPLSDYVYKEGVNKPSGYLLSDNNYQKDANKQNYYISDHKQNKDLTKQSYVSSDYSQKNNSVKEADFNSSLSDYSQKKLSSTQFEFVSPDYTYKKDTTRDINYQSSDSILRKQSDYISSDYDHKNDSSKQGDYSSSDCYQKKDSRLQADYDSSGYNQKSDSREGVYSTTHVHKYKERSLSPPKQEINKEVTPPPFPSGTDWPYESSSTTAEPSTYNDYYSWQQKDTDKQTHYYDQQIEKDYPSKKIEDFKNEPPTAASSKSDSSLSIEETNKLRAKLGLKPLKLGDASAPQEQSYADRDDVHRPATNISDKKSEEKIREKMEAIREKRKINKKLQKVKGLGEEDDPVLDSAAAWVANSRIQEKEKAMAAKRAEMLEEMDKEFGVTKIMAKSILKKKSKYDQYDSRDLKGLRVEHRGSEFAEGESVILTLKDKDVLDEDYEDVLHNINVQEYEKAKLNIKNKSKSSGYQAYDEVDEETGEFKVRTVLDKYDEEIEGEKRDSFRIDVGGTADLNGENRLNNIRALLKSQQVSLAAQSLKLARDYYTNEEMVSFKKPRKRKVRKIRKREILKADDLLKMDLQKDRKKLKSALKNSNKPLDEEDLQDDMDMITEGPDELDYFVAVNQHEGEEALPEEDDRAEQELQLALERSRRAKLRNIQGIGDENAIVEKVAREVLSKPQVKEEGLEVSSGKMKKKAKGAIVLDSTSEFCRTLGDIPTFGVVLEAEQKSDDDMDLGDEAATTAGGWEQVEMIDQPKEENTVEEDDDVLEAEPIPTGLAATLSLANMKGYLKDGKEKVRKFDPLNLPETKAEVDIEKLRDEEKIKYARGYERERERDRYDSYQFKEKTNYKPDIKLEYVDNKGRQMNQKEAFRLLSHKFHGKGSGKLKTEKRSKKLLDEKKLQMMSSIDTPLNTAALFKDKQKQSQSAYLVLSGGGKNILSGETLKK